MIRLKFKERWFPRWILILFFLLLFQWLHSWTFGTYATLSWSKLCPIFTRNWTCILRCIRCWNWETFNCKYYLIQKFISNFLLYGLVETHKLTTILFNIITSSWYNFEVKSTMANMSLYFFYLFLFLF